MATVPFNYAPASAAGAGATINVPVGPWSCTMETPLAVEVVSLATGEVVANPPFTRNAGGGGVVTSVDVANTTGGAANAYVRRAVEAAQEWSPRSESGANLRTLEASLNAVAQGVQQVHAEVFGSEDPAWSGGVVRAADGFRIAPAEVRAGKLLRFDESGEPVYEDGLTEEMLEELEALDGLGAGLVKKTSSDPAAYSAVASTAFGEALVGKASAALARAHLGAQVQDGDLDALSGLAGAGFARRTGESAWALADAAAMESFLDLGSLAHEDAEALETSIVPATSGAVSLGSAEKFFADVRCVDAWAGELHTANGVLMGDGNIRLLNGDVGHNDGSLVLQMENASGAATEFARLLAAHGSEPNWVQLSGGANVTGIGTAFVTHVHAGTSVKLNAGGVSLTGGGINHNDDILAVYLKDGAGNSYEMVRLLAMHGSWPGTVHFENAVDVFGINSAQVQQVLVGDGGAIVNAGAGGIGVTGAFVLPNGLVGLGAGVEEPPLNFGGASGAARRGIWHDAAGGALKVRWGSSDVVAIDGSAVHVAGNVVFEGATADAHETTLAVADPTADRTILLPNASGTAAVFGVLPGADNRLVVANGTAGAVEAANVMLLPESNAFMVPTVASGSGGQLVMSSGSTDAAVGDGGTLGFQSGGSGYTSGVGGPIVFWVGPGATKDGNVTFVMSQVMAEAGDFNVSQAHDIILEGTNSILLAGTTTINGLVSVLQAANFAEALTSKRHVTASSATSISQSASDTKDHLHVAAGQTAKQVRTLPAAAAGLRATFANMDSDGLRLVAATGDNIRFGTQVSVAAGYVESTAVGACITLEAIDATTWLVTSAMEAWTVQT